MTTWLLWERIRLGALGLFSRHPESSVQGVNLVDLRADRLFDHDQIRQVLVEALEQVKIARGGFPELVNDHLRHVVAIDTEPDSASSFAEAFYTTFSARERRQPFALACRLVWAATFIRLQRNQRFWKRSQNRRAARIAAKDAQITFARQFPDREDWVTILERQEL